MKVLANDGISQSGIDALEKGGFEVITSKPPFSLSLIHI